MDKDYVSYILYHKHLSYLELFISYKMNVVFYHLQGLHVNQI